MSNNTFGSWPNTAVNHVDIESALTAIAIRVPCGDPLPARLGQRFELQHRHLGANALAAPIVTPTGVTGSVGAIAPQQRFDDAREAAMADAVVAAASELGRRLGDPVVGLRGLTGGTS
jgi:hypothetical protein